jgi:hypothetical protein
MTREREPCLRLSRFNVETVLKHMTTKFGVETAPQPSAYLAPQVSEFVLLESLKQAGCMD